MHIEEFKDLNQIAPHANEHEKRGILIPHQGNDFKKSILEMSVILTKYVGLIRPSRQMWICSLSSGQRRFASQARNCNSWLTAFQN